MFAISQKTQIVYTWSGSINLFLLKQVCRDHTHPLNKGAVMQPDD